MKKNYVNPQTVVLKLHAEGMMATSAEASSAFSVSDDENADDDVLSEEGEDEDW